MYILGHIYQQFRAYSKLPFPHVQEGSYLASFLPIHWNNHTIVLVLLLLFCLILFFVFVLISFFISDNSLHNITVKLTFHDTQRLHPLNALFYIYQQFRVYSKLCFPHLQEGLYLATLNFFPYIGTIVQQFWFCCYCFV